MYFHVHIISILAAVALHRKHKPREPTTTKTSSVSSSAPCSAQCQHVHSNNNDKDWKSHFAFFYQAFRTRSPLKDKWVSLGHSASLKWENIVLFIFWLYRVKEICTYGTGCVRGEPSPMIEAHQADTEEKPQLRKWFWYNHRHQNAGPQPPFPFYLLPLPAAFPPSLAISPAPACLLQQQYNSVKRVLRLTFVPVLNLCCPTDWWDLSQHSGSAAHKRATNTRTHAHANSCINRH